MSLKVMGTQGVVDRVSALLKHPVGPRQENGHRVLIFAFPDPDPNQMVFRSLDLYEYQNATGALGEYESYRQLFTRSGDWRLFRESGASDDRYFLSYQAARWNTNHGLPIGVITTPDILLGVLKRNLFIAITYNAFQKTPDYVKAMNRDVLFVAELLRKAGA